MKSKNFRPQVPAESLSSHSSAWRWLLALTLLSAAVFATSKPWQTLQPAQTKPLASYSAPQKHQLSPGAPARSPEPKPVLPIDPARHQSDAITDVQTGSMKASMQALVPAPASAVSNTYQSTSPVRWANSGDQGSISGGGLTASHCCVGPYSTVYADTAVMNGKHYLELMISVRPGAQNPDTWTQVGITSTVTGRHAPSVNNKSSDGTSYSLISWGQYKNFVHGDVVMMAIDMDKRMFYWGVNGQWQNGDPGVGSGDPLVTGKSYRPFVSISSSSRNPEGDKWVANFGSRPFKYPMPAGYASYGTYSSRAVSAATPLPVPSGTAQASSSGNAYVDQFFSNQVTLLEKTVPLPEGRWRGIGYMQVAANQVELVALAKFEKQKLVELVAVKAQNSSGGKPRAAGNTCGNPEAFARKIVVTSADGPQLCWWINHAAQIWTQPLFNLSAATLSQLSVPLPATLINTGFHKADVDGAVTVFYYSNPEAAGISTQPSNWQSSEWHKDRVASHPEKQDYLRKREAWAESWLPLIRAAK